VDEKETKRPRKSKIIIQKKICLSKILHHLAIKLVFDLEKLIIFKIIFYQKFK